MRRGACIGVAAVFRGAALERAYRDHDWVMVNLLVDEGFAPVRREPRFKAMVRRVGLPTA